MDSLVSVFGFVISAPFFNGATQYLIRGGNDGTFHD